MKYLRRTAGYRQTDYKTNTQIAKLIKNNTNFGGKHVHDILEGTPEE
jgi:hypothetical protein